MNKVDELKEWATKEIRHKLLIEEGDNWVEKIQRFLK